MGTKAPEKTNRFCQTCPRQLSALPGESCGQALERIMAIQADPKADHDGIGCPWYIISKEHNYCFWNYMADVQDRPHTDKEIAELLGMQAKDVKRVTAEAIAKLEAIKDTTVMQDFKEAIYDYAARNGTDNTVYMPNKFKEQAYAANEDNSEEDDAKIVAKPKPARQNRSQPIHRDGKKRDIFFAKKKRNET